METILIVEDDHAAQKTLKRLFESEGYHTEIRGDGKSGLEAFRTVAPTAIILDLRLPLMPGDDVCREIRRTSSTVPIIVLSAVMEEADKVLLLGLGADDYVTKPFSPRELVARVRAAIRRMQQSKIPDHAKFGFACVNFTRMEVTFNGEPVALTAQEFKLLKFLIENAQRVVSRGEILSNAFGYEDYSQTRTVDTHILSLRQKLEKEPHNPVHILTLHGVGYKFVP